MSHEVGGAGLVDLGAPPVAGAIVAVPAQNPAPPPGQGEEFGKASPVALVVIILLAITTVVLIRSMTRRIKRLPSSFDAEPPRERADDTSDDATQRHAEEPAEEGPQRQPDSPQREG